MSGTAVAARTASGVVWQIGTRIAARALDFATFLVLARVLSPRDFGLIALAMTTIYIVEAILELPLNSALVRLHAITDEHLNTAFTLGVMRGFIVAAMVSGIAYPFSVSYGDPRLFALVAALGLAPAVRGLVSPAIATYTKRGDFSREFLIETSGKIVASIVAITMALVTGSYWALAVGTITAPLIGTSVSYVIAPFRARFSLVWWRSFAGFAGWTSTAQILAALNWQIDKLVMGRVVSAAAVGRYSLASDLAGLPEQMLLRPMMRPIISGMVAVRDDRERMLRAYERVDRTIMTLMIPAALCIAGLADPFVRIVLGEKWLSAAPLLGILALCSIPNSIASALGSTAVALDQPRMLLFRNAIEASFRVPLLIIGIVGFGIEGAVVARLVASVALGITSMLLLRHLIGLSLRRQVQNIWRPVLAGICCAIVLLVLHPVMQGHSGVALIVAAGVVGGAALACYTGTLIGLALIRRQDGAPENMLIETVLSRLGRHGG